MLAAGELDAVNAFSVLELSNYMKNTLLRDGDAMSMAHALEVRVPMLDHLVVEKAMAVPGALKLSRKLNKPLLAASLADIPADLMNRPKMGFALPLDVWFRGPLRAWMEGMIFDVALRRLPMLRRRAVEGQWQAFLSAGLPGRPRVSHACVWSVAALGAWCEANAVSA
jgi:asparagine synthase (glutamine-hydrolysing)